MTPLREAAQQALELLGTWAKPPARLYRVMDNLRAALAQEQAVTDDMRSAVRWAPSSAYWSERLREFFGPDAREGIDALERRLAKAQEPKAGGNLPPPLQAEPDLSRCPQCNGPADNGHDRSIPPSPYLCTSCMAEPVQEPVAWAGYDLDSMAEAFSRVIEAHHSNRHPFHNPLDMDARMALRILRGFLPAMKAFTAPPKAEPLTNQCGETCERAKLCATCARELNHE